MRIARILITLSCNRKCQNCCNSYPSIIKNAKKLPIEKITGFDQIIITGGEPMLYPDKTMDVTRALRYFNHNAKFYLYTALYLPELINVMLYFDGMTFAIHKEASKKDIADFENLQEKLIELSSLFTEKFIRLSIDVGIKHRLIIAPKAWDFIKMKPMMSEAELIEMSPTKTGLPANEELILLKAPDDRH